VPAFEGVDVYPLLAHVLGLEPASNDGDFDAAATTLRESPRTGDPMPHAAGAARGSDGLFRHRSP
jgi:hypothetical protein